MFPSPAPTLPVTRVSSVEAHVLPHTVDVAPAAEGIVTDVFVRERDVVSGGQQLLALVSAGHRSLVMRSPVPGVVTQCTVHAGDAVTRSRPVFRITRADDVLVVAQFDPSAGSALRQVRSASVRIASAAGRPLSAAIVSVGAPPTATDAAAARPGAPLHVVARLEAAPPAAMWPGLDAVLEVECGAPPAA